MAKFKELSKLSKKEADDRIKELRLDLIKARVAASKGGKVKIRGIKKTLSQLIMLRNNL